MWIVFKWWRVVTIIKKKGCLEYVTLAAQDPQGCVGEVTKRVKTFRETSL